MSSFRCLFFLPDGASSTIEGFVFPAKLRCRPCSSSHCRYFECYACYSSKMGPFCITLVILSKMGPFCLVVLRGFGKTSRHRALKYGLSRSALRCTSGSTITQARSNTGAVRCLFQKRVSNPTRDERGRGRSPLHRQHQSCTSLAHGTMTKKRTGRLMYAP